MSKLDTYIDNTEAQLQAWSAEIDRLSAQARKAPADLRAQYSDQIEELRKRRREAEERLHDLEVSSGSQFDELRSRTNTALTNLRTTLDNTWSNITRSTTDAAEETPEERSMR